MVTATAAAIVLVVVVDVVVVAVVVMIAAVVQQIVFRLFCHIRLKGDNYFRKDGDPIAKLIIVI